MSTYRSNEGPFTKSDFEFTIPFKHQTFSEINSYKHCNLPVSGVGPEGPRNPFVYFDDVIDFSDLDQIKKEVMDGYRNQKVYFNKLVANGIVPENCNNQKCIDSLLNNLSKYTADESWKAQTDLLTRKGDIKYFFQNYFKIPMAWEGIAQFREYSNDYQDKTRPSQWFPLIENFPTLKKFVEKLPFKHIGYVMIFKSIPNTKVLIHRDFYPTNHTGNFINIRLDNQARPFFLYDFETREKIYLDSNKRSYFFNEIDPHGADEEDTSRLTLRVEGAFTEEFKKEFPVVSRDIFNWDYDHVRQFLNSKKFFIENNTDI